MPLIEVHLIEKTRSSGPPHHRHVLGGAATAMTEGEGVSLMNPNKTLWEKGEITEPRRYLASLFHLKHATSDAVVE